MELEPGSTIWIPCEVKPGPFTNERLIRVESLYDPWVGFVNVRFLKDDILEGSTLVRGRVVSVEGDTFEAKLPGHAIESAPIFRGQRGQVTLAPLPA